MVLDKQCLWLHRRHTHEFFSYKYTFRSSDKPGGVTMSGSVDVEKWWLGLLRMVMLISFASASCLTDTPFSVEVNLKWWYLVMLFSFLKCGLKYPHQSYVGTRVSPSWSPTNCTVLTLADDSTTPTKSSRQFTTQRRYRCFSNPKHQSGENFVCPTSMNDRMMESYLPAQY